MAHLRSNSLSASRQHPRLTALALEASAASGGAAGGVPSGAPPLRSASHRSLVRHSRQSGCSSGGGSAAGSSRGSDGDLFLTAAALGSGGGGGGGPPGQCHVYGDEKGRAAPPALEAAYRKAQARLLPILMLVVGLNYIDRTSVAFAGIQMTKDLGFGPCVFGVGSGIFFVAYCAAQIPANLACVRVGVTRWFTGSMLAWGAAAAAFAGVRRAWQFFVLRVALGLAEAGTFPCAWHAISLWLPPDRIAYPYALLGTAVAAGQVLAAPLSATLLSFDGLWGLRGWQWVFIGEAVPSLCLGCMLPWLLPDAPSQGACSFLSHAELELLKEDHMARTWGTRNAPVLPAAAGALPLAPPRASAGRTLLRVARIWQLWCLALINILKDMANMALMAWLPIMVEALLSGGDPTHIAAKGGAAGGGHAGEGPAGSARASGAAAALLSAIPFTCAAAMSAAAGAAVQRTGRPLLYLSVLNWAGGAAFMAFGWAVAASRALGFCCLVVTLSCAYAAAPSAPVVVARLTSGPNGGAALAMPLFNSVAMLGGFLGPSLMGVLTQRARGDIGAATAPLGACMFAAGVAAAALERAMLRDPRTRGAVCAKAEGQAGPGAGGQAGGYEMVAQLDGSPGTP